MSEKPTTQPKTPTDNKASVEPSLCDLCSNVEDPVETCEGCGNCFCPDCGDQPARRCEECEDKR